MAGKKGNFSHKGGVTVDFFGFEELLQKIDDAGGNVVDAVVEAAKASSKPIKADLLGFMAKHRLTGATEASFTDVQEVKKGYGIISYKLGFDKEHDGLPALFLDIGTPTIKPTFFVYHAFEDNVDKVKAEQEAALRKAFEELM